MPNEAVKCQKEEGYYILTLNRPERLNAIGKQIVKEVSSLLDEIPRAMISMPILLRGHPGRMEGLVFVRGLTLRISRKRDSFPFYPS